MQRKMLVMDSSPGAQFARQPGLTRTQIAGDGCRPDVEVLRDLFGSQPAEVAQFNDLGLAGIDFF